MASQPPARELASQNTHTHTRAHKHTQLHSQTQTLNTHICVPTHIDQIAHTSTYADSFTNKQLSLDFIHTVYATKNIIVVYTVTLHNYLNIVVHNHIVVLHNHQDKLYHSNRAQMGLYCKLFTHTHTHTHPYTHTNTHTALSSGVCFLSTASDWIFSLFLIWLEHAILRKEPKAWRFFFFVCFKTHSFVSLD